MAGIQKIKEGKMAKKEENSPIMDFFREVPGMFALNPMVGPHVEQFWQAQQKILQEAEMFSSHWFDRRQTATQTALDVAREMTAKNGSHPAECLKKLTQWQTNSMERIAEDFREWTDLCTRCAGHVASAEVEADKDGLADTAKRVASASKMKHAIPV